MRPKGIVSLNQRFERGHIAVDRHELAIADVIAHKGVGSFTKTGRGLLLYGLKPEIKEAFNRGDPEVLDLVLQREVIGGDTLITLAEGSELTYLAASSTFMVSRLIVTGLSFARLRSLIFGALPRKPLNTVTIIIGTLA